MTFLASLLSAFALVSVQTAAEDEAAVREVFENYKQAVVEADGDLSVANASQSTFDFYDGMRRDALYADAAELAEDSMFYRATVYGTRSRYTADQLLGMDGAAFFAAETASGDTAAQASLLTAGDVTVSGDSASVTVFAAGQQSPIPYRYVRENGAWKFDAAALISDLDTLMTPMLQNAGVSEEDFVNLTLQQLGYANGFDERIRNPLASE